MFITFLSLSNFRNYQKSEFKFLPAGRQVEQTTLIIGPNTVGKTNLLEAIYFLSQGKSFRAGSDRESIYWEAQSAKLKAQSSNDCHLEIILTTGEVNGVKTPLKRYLVNGVSKRQIDFVGRLLTVIFRPEDLELITDSPGIRRDYLDSVLIQVDRDYRRSLLAYEKGLRQRNRLLAFIRDGKASHQQLYFWDKLLIKNGSLITLKRQELINFLNSHIGSSAKLTVNPERSRGVDIFADLEIEYDLSAISEERLLKYKEEEIAAGVTLVGPHRDDFIVYQRKDKTLRNVHRFGSRGEQRLAVLALKLCELDFIEQKIGERPILLLDDILSELDENYRSLVVRAIPRQQTIITTTDIHFVEDYLDKMTLVKLPIIKNKERT